MAAAAVGALVATPAMAAAPRTIIKTTDFAGYIADVPGTVSSFSGKVSIPTVTCPPTGTQTLEPVADLHTSGNFLAFEDSITCSDGTQTSGGFFASIYPAAGGNDLAATNLATAPGDVVTMKLTITAAGVATMKISDAKAGTSGSATSKVTGTLTTVQAGTDVFGGSPTVVPSFTPPISFTGLKAGTASLATLSPAEYEIYNGTTLQVATTKPSAGGSFKNPFDHS